MGTVTIWEMDPNLSLCNGNMFYIIDLLVAIGFGMHPAGEKAII